MANLGLKQTHTRLCRVILQKHVPLKAQSTIHVFWGVGWFLAMQ